MKKEMILLFTCEFRVIFGLGFIEVCTFRLVSIKSLLFAYVLKVYRFMISNYIIEIDVTCYSLIY